MRRYYDCRNAYPSLAVTAGNRATEYANVPCSALQESVTLPGRQHGCAFIAHVPTDGSLTRSAFEIYNSRYAEQTIDREFRSLRIPQLYDD